MFAECVDLVAGRNWPTCYGDFLLEKEALGPLASNMRQICVSMDNTGHGEGVVNEKIGLPFLLDLIPSALAFALANARLAAMSISWLMASWSSQRRVGYDMVDIFATGDSEFLKGRTKI